MSARRTSACRAAPRFSLPISRAAFSVCCLWLLLVLCGAQLTQITPLYSGSYSAKLNSAMPPYEPPGTQAIWLRSLDIDAPLGNDFVALLAISNNAGGLSAYQIRGSFGCSNGLLETSFASISNDQLTAQCQAIGKQNGPVGLCESGYLLEHCTGTNDYSTYETIDGVYQLQIKGWCGIEGDVVLSCVGTCVGSVQCASSIQQTIVQGGTVISNGGTIITNAGNNTIYSNGSTINIELSRNVTIESNAPNITINLNYTTTTVQSQANQTYLNTGPLRTCADWLDYASVVNSNATYTDSPTQLIAAAATARTGDGTSTWSLPSASVIAYGASLSGVSYLFTYCLQEASVFVPVGVTQAQRVVLALYNISASPTPLAPSISTAVHQRNLDGTRTMLSSACGAFITDQVRPNDVYSFFLSSEYDSPNTGSSLRLAPGALFALSIVPTGCSGNINNITFNITVQFANGTLIKPGYYINITTDQQDGSFRVNNEGLVDVTPNTAGTYPDRCLYGTRDDRGILTLHDSSVCAVDANGGTPRGGRISLQSSATVNVTNTGGNNFSFSTEVLSFTGSKCYTLSKSGSTVTAGGTSICSINVNGASSACLSGSVNANGNFTLTTEGVCGFQDTTTVTFSQPSPGIYSAQVTLPTGQNLTKCGVTCDETSETLNVEKLCAKEQCKVESQPPVTEPSTPFVFFPCLFCGGGGGGDDDDGSDGPGDDDDGSSSNFPLIPPIIPFLPPLLPFFPPIVPIIAGTGPGGGGGGPGSGVKPTPGPGSPPPIPVPIIITVPPGAPEPITAGGTVLPGTNFTQTPVYCGNATHRQIVVDQSTLPELMYICMLTANGTYAWVPHCPCNGAAANATVWYYNTSVLYQQGSTLYVSNSSQMIVEGATYLGGPVYVGGEVTFNSTASFCPTTGNGTSLKADHIESCTNGPVDFPEGISIGGVPLTPSNTSSMFNNGSVLLTNGSTLYISNSSSLTVDGTTTFTGPLSFCPSTPEVAIFKRIGGCNGNPVILQYGFTSEAPSAINQAFNINGPSLIVTAPATFTNTFAVCSAPIRTNTISSCDGTSKVNFPTGINTTTLVADEIQAPPSGTIVISGSNVTLAGPVTASGGVSTTTVVATTAVIATQNVTTQYVGSQQVVQQAITNQNVLNQIVTTQVVQDITVVNTPVFAGTAFYYTAAASYSGQLQFCVSWSTSSPAYASCAAASTPAFVNVQLQRVGNMVYGTINRTDVEPAELIFGTGAANSAILFAPTGVIVGADFRPRAGTIAAGTEAQPFLLEYQGTANMGCFCSLVPYVTDVGLLFFRPRAIPSTLATQCCTLGNSAGEFKSSTAFQLAARGTYSGLLAANAYSPGLDDLYTFSYVLPL